MPRQAADTRQRLPRPPYSAEGCRLMGRSSRLSLRGLLLRGSHVLDAKQVRLSCCLSFCHIWFSNVGVAGPRSGRSLSKNVRCGRIDLNPCSAMVRAISLAISERREKGGSGTPCPLKGEGLKMPCSSQPISQIWKLHEPLMRGWSGRPRHWKRPRHQRGCGRCGHRGGADPVMVASTDRRRQHLEPPLPLMTHMDSD